MILFFVLIHNLCFPAACRNVFCSLSSSYVFQLYISTISPPLSPICSLLDEKPFWWLIGEWCCYLESHSISTEGGEESARREREKLRRSSGSLGRCSCDGWAVKRPIVQITQQAPCHHSGLIYGAVQCGTNIALWEESAGETSDGKGCKEGVGGPT